jgi:hypothetical protein
LASAPDSTGTASPVGSPAPVVEPDSVKSGHD